MPESQSAERADRILDVAATLLVRHGYRKVTIDDVARRAGIGKGTVYLHWRTKQQLFEAVVLREAIGYIEDLLGELRRDPATLLPHRLLPASFLVILARPVLREMFTTYVEMPYGRAADDALRSHELLATDRFYDALTRHGLIRDDVPNLAYTLGAAMRGFYLGETLDPAADGLDEAAKAESIAHIVRHAFEPAVLPGPGALAAAVAEVITVFEDVIPPYRKWIYESAEERATP